MHHSLQNQDVRYSKIKSISDINKEKIYAAKRIRESKGDAHHHEEQCMTIPNEIDLNEHGIHLEPCYKKFVLKISQEKKRSLDSADISTRPKRSKPSDGQISRDVYSKECNLCNKYRIMRNGKYIFPVTISTQQAVNMIKDAAEAKEDQKLFFEIKDLDLIAKEFKYRDACYREYTRKVIRSKNEMNHIAIFNKLVTLKPLLNV